MGSISTTLTARATNIVYHKNFAPTEVLQDITQLYHDTKKHYLV